MIALFVLGMRPDNRTGGMRPNNRTGGMRPNNRTGGMRPNNRTGGMRPNNRTGGMRPNRMRPDNRTGGMRPNNRTGGMRPDRMRPGNRTRPDGMGPDEQIGRRPNRRPPLSCEELRCGRMETCGTFGEDERRRAMCVSNGKVC